VSEPEIVVKIVCCYCKAVMREGVEPASHDAHETCAKQSAEMQEREKWPNDEVK
jgi:hypothetical protein